MCTKMLYYTGNKKNSLILLVRANKVAIPVLSNLSCFFVYSNS